MTKSLTPQTSKLKTIRTNLYLLQGKDGDFSHYLHDHSYKLSQSALKTEYQMESEISLFSKAPKLQINIYPGIGI